jgi:hypothetical protein
MPKKGAVKKVGKQKQGKGKDFAGSGVEGEKGSGKEPDQKARRILIVDHISKLNFELTSPAIVLEAVQVVIPNATEAEVVAAIAEYQAQKDPANQPPETINKETKAKAHLEKIVVAIDELDPNSKKDFTEQGKPDANVLADILDAKVSAADRDKAWKIYQAQDRPITIDHILKRKRRGGMKI